MKKWLIGSLAATSLFLAGCASKEVASTEAGKIREDEFVERMKNEPLQGGMTVGQSVLQKMLLSDSFEHKYGEHVSKEDVDQKYEKDAEALGGVESFEQIMQNQGLSKEYIQNNIRFNLLMREAVKDNVEITDEDLKQKYEEKKPFAKAQHILVKDEETANQLIEELNNGADFSELVNEHTVDTASKENDGVYTIAEGEMVPEFEEAVKNLEVGEMTQEPVESSHGFHIIKRLEFDEAQDFEEKKEDLRDQIISDYTSDSAFMTQLISDILTDMNVQIADDELKAAIAPFVQTEKSEDEQGTTEESTEDTDEQEDTSAEENTDDASGDQGEADQSESGEN